MVAAGRVCRAKRRIRRRARMFKAILSKAAETFVTTSLVV
jgi:hypothetical protein